MLYEHEARRARTCATRSSTGSSSASALVRECAARPRAGRCSSPARSAPSSTEPAGPSAQTTASARPGRRSRSPGKLPRDDPAVAVAQLVRRVQPHGDGGVRVLDEERAARREGLAVPRRGRPRSSPCCGSFGRPVAESFIGQLPAGSASSTCSDACAPGACAVPASLSVCPLARLSPLVAGDVAAEEGKREHQDGCGEQRDAALDRGATRDRRASSRASARASISRRQLGRRPGDDEQVVHALEPLALLAPDVARRGRRNPASASCELLSFEDAGEPGQRTPRPCLHRAERDVQDTPRPRSATGRSSRQARRPRAPSPAAPRAHGEPARRHRTPRRVRPGPASDDARSGASAGGSVRARMRSTIAFRATRRATAPAGPRSGPVARGRPPDRGEGLLDGILRALPVPQAAERKPEDRADVAVVEELEGLAVALGDADEQLGIGRVDWSGAAFCLRHGTQPRRGFERKLHISSVSTRHGGFRIRKS